MRIMSAFFNSNFSPYNLNHNFFLLYECSRIDLIISFYKSFSFPIIYGYKFNSSNHFEIDLTKLVNKLDSTELA